MTDNNYLLCAGKIKGSCSDIHISILSLRKLIEKKCHGCEHVYAKDDMEEQPIGINNWKWLNFMNRHNAKETSFEDIIGYIDKKISDISVELEKLMKEKQSKKQKRFVLKKK